MEIALHQYGPSAPPSTGYLNAFEFNLTSMSVHGPLLPILAVLAAARAFHEQVQAKEQRSAVVLAALEAEGLQDYNNPSALPGLTKFVERGEGRLQQLVAAARRLRRQDDKLNARRARLEELLAAQGLQQYASTRAANAFLRGRGSEAEVLEAAHAEAHQAAARQQREHALKAALHAEGIDFDKASTGTPGRRQLPVVTKFIDAV